MSEDWGSCQNCGRLLLGDGGPGYDDVVSRPYVTEAGDVYCIPCGLAADEADGEIDAPKSDEELFAAMRKG